MSRLDMVCAVLACAAKLALPPVCVNLLKAPSTHDCAPAHLSHGRGAAGEFLPDAEAAFTMGAAAEVATLP